MLGRLSYVLRETWASFRRNMTLTIAAIITSAVALLIFGLTSFVQKGFDNLVLYLDNLVRRQTMGLEMALVGRLGVGRVDQTANRLGLRVEPVLEVFDAEPLLRLEVAEMRLHDVFRGGIGVVMDIHVERHSELPSIPGQVGESLDDDGTTARGMVELIGIEPTTS